MLKQHYKEKQMLNFFIGVESCKNESLFRDTLSECYFAKEIIEQRFQKVSCNITAIHDEFIRCSREERFKNILNQILEYSSDEKKRCIELKNYKIKLPHTGKELFEWSEVLHNCISSYFQPIKNKETIIYGFFKDEALVFAVEIEDKKVVQASTKYNNELADEHRKILARWLAISLIFHEQVRIF